MMSSDPPIREIRAANPSPLTGSGTNTWLIGATDLAVIDPGPDLEAHLAAILASVRSGQRISHILVTHAHLDHSSLAPRLAASTGAPVLAHGTATEGRSPLMSSLAQGMRDHGEGLDHAFTPDLRLKDGDSVMGPDWSLTALHTPGHLGGHLCLSLGATLFSGDHVMGWSTSVVSPPDGDMGAYMTSLHRLSETHWHRMLPGHGEPVLAPQDRLQQLIAHRRGREAQILAALTDGPARIPALTARIYHDTPPHLLAAAQRNVFAHLIDLTSRNQVTARPGILPDAEFARI
jgi:glyoxylase-like metal-dependent hydrolase (beta-lactamase superfamily II)